VIGKEIADAIAPIAMWVSIVGAVIGLIWYAIRHHNKGVIARDDLEEANEAARNRQEAEAGIKDRRDNLTDIFDSELSDNEDS